MIKKPLSNRLAARLLSAALAIILLFAGMGAAPAQTTPPPPPDPDRYHNWRHPEKDLPLPVIQGNVQPQGAPSLQACNSGAPNKLDWTALVFTGVLYGGSNRDIYYNRGVCSGSTPTRLTTDPGWDTAARLNRDATQVVFMSDRTGNDDIYLMSSTGAGQTNLTNSPYYEGMPSFAGTDSRIVFVSDRYGDADIFIMNPDGSGQYQVTSGPNEDIEPDWSPDGKLITFSRRIPNSNSAQIYVMNWDGTNLHAITPPLAYASRPVWSPSGTRISFGFDFDGDSWFDLAVVNADGSGLSALPIAKGSKPYTDFYNGGWLPDESGLVFSDKYYIYNLNPPMYMIQAYNADEVLFSNITVAQPLILGPWLGSWPVSLPHTRSMDDVPPVSSLAALPEYSPYDNVPLNWTVTDAVSGLAKLTLQFNTTSDPSYLSPGWRTPGAGWNMFNGPLLPAQTGQTKFQGTPGDKVYFRAQAMDSAGNIEPLKNAEISTRLYRNKLSSWVTDTRKRPLSGATTVLTPAAMLPLTTDADGKSLTYTTEYIPYQAVVSKPGYATLPTQTWGPDGVYITALPGTGEQIVNGQFEDTTNPDPNNPFPGWSASGGTVTTWRGRLSSQAAYIHVPTATPQQVILSQQVTIPADLSEPTISFYYDAGGNVMSTLKARFTPQGEAGFTFFAYSGSQTGWTYAWFDMTPFRGKTGTLAFVVDSPGGYSAMLDQVSLASALGMTIDQVSPVHVTAPLESDLTVDVRGTNFQAGDTLTFGGTSAPITLLDSTHLTFVIPAGTPAGPYPVRIQPSGGVEVTDTQPVFIGSFLYLPFTMQR